MGTGSYGGSGGGGGSGSSSGALLSGLSPRFVGGHIRTVTPQEQELKQGIAKIFRSQGARPYIIQQLSSPLTRSLYEQLFTLSVDFMQNRSWAGVQRTFEVTDSSGCLPRLVDAMITRFANVETSRKVREVARLCIEDFLLRVVGNDIQRYMYGTADDVIAAVDPAIFRSTSGYFLGGLLRRIVEREHEKLDPGTERQIHLLIQQRADEIVDAFDHQFRNRQQATFRDLFRVIQENPSWILKLLTK